MVPRPSASPVVGRVAFFGALAVTFIAAMWPATGSASFSHQDKLIHALAFAVLAVLGWMAGYRRAGCLWMFLVAFGVAIEAAQALTPTRTPEIADVLADAAGAALVWVLARRRAGRGRITS